MTDLKVIGGRAVHQLPDGPVCFYCAAVNLFSAVAISHGLQLPMPASGRHHRHVRRESRDRQRLLNRKIRELSLACADATLASRDANATIKVELPCRLRRATGSTTL